MSTSLSRYTLKCVKHYKCHCWGQLGPVIRIPCLKKCFQNGSVYGAVVSFLAISQQDICILTFLLEINHGIACITHIMQKKITFFMIHGNMPPGVNNGPHGAFAGASPNTPYMVIMKINYVFTAIFIQFSIQWCKNHVIRSNITYCTDQIV